MPLTQGAKVALGVGAAAAAAYMYKRRSETTGRVEYGARQPGYEPRYGRLPPANGPTGVPPPASAKGGAGDSSRLSPSEYVDRSGLSDRGAPPISERVSQAADVVKEHAKAAATDVSQTASEVGRVVKEHGVQAARDVSGARGEVSDTLAGRPPEQVRVRDTADIVTPGAGGGEAGGVRSVPLQQAGGGGGGGGGGGSKSVAPSRGGNSADEFQRMQQHAEKVVRDMDDFLEEQRNRVVNAIGELAERSGRDLADLLKADKQGTRGTGTAGGVSKEGASGSSGIEPAGRGEPRSGGAGLAAEGSSEFTGIPMPGTGAPSAFVGYDNDVRPSRDMFRRGRSPTAASQPAPPSVRTYDVPAGREGKAGDVLERAERVLEQARERTAAASQRVRSDVEEARKKVEAAEQSFRQRGGKATSGSGTQPAGGATLERPSATPSEPTTRASPADVSTTGPKTQAAGATGKPPSAPGASSGAAS